MKHRTRRQVRDYRALLIWAVVLLGGALALVDALRGGVVCQ